MSNLLVRTLHKANLMSVCIRRNHCRHLTNAAVQKKRCEIWDQEKERQLSLLPRIEKIEVKHIGPPEECTLLMNKHLSTPYNCAMHIHEVLMKRSVVALVNGKPWDLHRPLVDDCELQFLHFRDEDSSISNNVFWRSCSFILGYITETAFKDEHFVELCSFPAPDVKSGSFVNDVDLKLENWQPNSSELRCLSRIGAQLGTQDLIFNRLEVDASLASKIFEDNRFKSHQIPSIAAKSSTGNTVTMYRLGDFIDISGGPMISSTNLIQRFAVAGVHQIESPDYGKLYRLQGLALPTQLPMHYWTFEFLEDRAKKLNPAPIPSLNKSNIAIRSSS